MERTSANHYEISDAGIEGVVDVAGIGGAPVVDVTVDGQPVSGATAETHSYGIRVAAVISQTEDGDSVYLGLVLPEVNVSDGPVTASGVAARVTVRSSIGGPGLVDGALQLYDVRPVSVVASAVQSLTGRG